MKMVNRHKVKILSMFLIVGLMSFIPENASRIFGDYTCEGASLKKEVNGVLYMTGCNRSMGNPHSPTTHWGFRHYVWFFAGLTFAVWTIVEVINDDE